MRPLAIVIFIVYGISLIFPNSERYIYNNEIFSALGLIILLSTKVKTLKFEKSLSTIYIFIFYGIFELCISIPAIMETQPYLALRTMPVWYSIFSFFLGVYCLKQFKTQGIIKFRNQTRYFAWISLFVTGFRLTPQVLFAIIAGDYKKYFIAIIVLFCLIKGGSTSYTALIVALAIYAMISYPQMRKLFGKKMLMLAIACFMASLYLLAPYLHKFLAVGYDGIGGDNNSTWRLMLWIYLFNEVFLHHPIFGIGFATPLFDLANIPSFVTTDDGSRFTEYTLGTHNSFFFILLRLGTVGLILTTLIHCQLFARAIKSLRTNQDKITNGITLSLILASAMFVNSALFNVVLESPLYAGNYWFTMGLMYQFSSRTLAKINNNQA
ncbi:O-antigen ligase family protein [Pseudomonas sp. Y24-6]|uniref:O-antigen ligase family protein n=1 Tax=Pseudomonas sp. Y24-6 TaxID=2750013 RepID=UPI001CE0F969|nr:O-antigen ligase family protein [Pseudomonas sp. Y24-6]MCA4962037.1 O-antigen ligase family protein [Pseudomonas sp. Y24-6]